MKSILDLIKIDFLKYEEEIKQRISYLYDQIVNIGLYGFRNMNLYLFKTILKGQFKIYL